MLNDMWYSDGWTDDQGTYNDWTYDNWYDRSNQTNDLDCWWPAQSDDAPTTSTDWTSAVPNIALTCDDIKASTTIVRSESEKGSKTNPLSSVTASSEQQFKEPTDEVKILTNKFMHTAFQFQVSPSLLTAQSFVCTGKANRFNP